MSVVVAHRLSGCSSYPPECGFSSCGTWAQLFPGIQNLPRTRDQIFPLHWQVNFYPLRHQGSPVNIWNSSDIQFAKVLCWTSYLDFLLHHAACGILVSRPGIEHVPWVMNMQCPNHWTGREFPLLDILLHQNKMYSSPIGPVSVATRCDIIQT